MPIPLLLDTCALIWSLSGANTIFCGCARLSLTKTALTKKPLLFRASLANREILKLKCTLPEQFR